MTELVLEMLLAQGELLGGEPDESVLVDVELDGVHAGHQQVDPEVELEPVDEEGVGDVALHDRVADPVRHLLQ